MKRIVIIGAGLLGCFSARALTEYDVEVIVLEKKAEPCLGISKTGAGIVYAGYDNKPGTMKSRFCIEANRSFAELCDLLDVRFRRCGSLMVSYGPEADARIRKKLDNGRIGGIEGLSIISKDEALALEPCLNPDISTALYSEVTGTCNPWELCLAAYECAVSNGAEFHFNEEVRNIARFGGTSEGFGIETDKATYTADTVINCAGMAAPAVREMTERPLVRLLPTMGDFLVTDDSVGGLINHVIFHEPEQKGKGLTIVPTVDGNLLIGPTERSLPGVGRTLSSDDYSRFGNPTDEEGIRSLYRLCADIVPGLPTDRVIRSYAAIRPNPYYVHEEDGSIIAEEKGISEFRLVEDGNLYSFIGIKTPGMTYAAQLGSYVTGRILASDDSLRKRSDYSPGRTAAPRVKDMSETERATFIAGHPAYGRIICECENISEGEIIEAIRRGATTVDGAKFRTGACMGECQGSRCRHEIENLLEKYSGKPAEIQEKAGRPSEKRYFDLLIIGAGAAGLTAAVAASRKGAGSILVVDKAAKTGGILEQCLHTGFGSAFFGEKMTGVQYASRLKKMLTECDGPIELSPGTTVLELRQDKTAVLSRYGEYYEVGFGRCILATGCRERTIQSLPVAGTRPEGIYTAGDAQARLNLYGEDIGDDIVILGTGDIGQIMARHYIEAGKNVIAMVEQADHAGGLEKNRRNIIEKYNIPLILNSTIVEIMGVGRIAGVKVRNLDTGEEQVIACSTLVTAMGLVPDRSLLAGFEADCKNKEGLPQWLTLLGNCDYVHDIVDSVCIEAEKM